MFVKQVNPNNVTPSDLIGNYRGIQINRGYKPGEWTMQITASTSYIKDPGSNVWVSGQVVTFETELWFISSKGTYRGIFTKNNLPKY